MVLNRQRRIPIALDPLKQFAERARRELRFAADAVTVCLVSDAAIARLNQTYRGKRGPTDVLSFPFAAKPTRAAGFQEGTASRGADKLVLVSSRACLPAGKAKRGIRFSRKRQEQAGAPPDAFSRGGFPHGAANPYAGDIAISPSAARRNARRLDRTLPAELRVLILHGMLHLAGYDHETDRGEMDRIERRLRRRLGLG